MLKNIKNRWKETVYYGAIYTIFFILLVVIIYYPFIKYGKSFIVSGDGINQHFPSIYYLRFYFRNVLKNIIEGNFSNILLLDFNLGFGYDVITTMGFYGLGDPLIFLSVFIKPENMEFFYNAIIILRLYLVGISFMCYCNYMGKNRQAALIGTLLYTFSGFAIYCAVRHPFFIIPMLYFPLFLLGIERLIAEKKGLMLSVVTALAVMSNFYFFYMLTVLGFLYAFIRYFAIYKKRSWKSLFSILCGGISYFIIGLGLAMIFLLPILLAYRNNARQSQVIFNIDLFYNFDYYMQLLFGIFCPAFMDQEYSILNVTPMALFGVIWLFTQKKYRSYKILFLTMVMLLCSPMGGFFMNGFGYVTHRWVWGLSFCFSYIVVLMCQHLEHLKLKFISLSFVGWGILLLIYLNVKSLHDLRVQTGLFFSFILLMMISAFYTKGCLKKIYPVMLSVTVLGLGLNGYFLNSPEQLQYINEFYDNGSVLPNIRQAPMGLLNSWGDSGFYRVSGMRTQTTFNKPLVMKYNSTTSYYSISPHQLIDYEINLGLSTAKYLFRFDGLGGRTVLETLSSVKYYCLWEGEDHYVPFGFQEVMRQQYGGRTAVIYKNDYFLPLGFAYDQYIFYDEYIKLSPLQKQQVMLHAVVLEENTDLEIEPTKMDLPNYAIDSMIVDNADIEYDRERGILHVKKPLAALELKYEGDPHSEIYVQLRGGSINSSTHINVDVLATDKDSGYQTDLFVMANGYGSFMNSYAEIEDYVINLGYYQEERSGCTLSFTRAGDYKLEDIILLSVPMDSYIEQIGLRKETVLEGIEVLPNRINGILENKKDQILCLTIPYSNGWSAYVDGKLTKLYAANEMYMALPVEQGKHQIRLQYMTPGLRTGALITLASIILCGDIIIWNKRNKIINVESTEK